MKPESRRYPELRIRFKAETGIEPMVDEVEEIEFYRSKGVWILNVSDEKATGLVGAGGTQYFRFKALKTGETEITLVYKRSWEESTPQDVTKVFTVNIR